MSGSPVELRGHRRVRFPCGLPQVARPFLDVALLREAGVEALRAAHRTFSVLLVGADNPHASRDHDTSAMRAAPTAAYRPEAETMRAALAAVKAHLDPTPLVASEAAGVLLKLESAQPTGSFKVRGAVAALSASAPDSAIITASSGNHALAVGWAAARLGRSVTVVVPKTASEAKLVQLRRFDDSVVQHGSGFDAAERFARERAAEADLDYLSAYNDRRVIAGQATLGLELEGLAPPLTVVCPVGGGGLLGGICAWAAERPGVRLVGVEPTASRAMSAACAAGEIVPVEVGPTLADGVAGNIEPGSVTVNLVRERVDELVAVGEDEIRAAIRYLIREQGLVAEGAGALALAAVLAGRVAPQGTCVAVLSGRNIARATLSRVLAPE